MVWKCYKYFLLILEKNMENSENIIPNPNLCESVAKIFNLYHLLVFTVSQNHQNLHQMQNGYLIKTVISYQTVKPFPQNSLQSQPFNLCQLLQSLFNQSNSPTTPIFSHTTLSTPNPNDQLYINQKMYIDDIIQIDGVNYQICALIGQGTVGTVYSCKSGNQKFALKQIRQYGRNPIVKQLVNQQVKTQQLFRGNPHIIQIFGNKIQNRKMYIVFELGSCSLRNRMCMQSHIQQKQFIDIALDTTKGIMAIHQEKLIHRDIKPENIICVQKTYKITDFGSLQTGTVGEGLIGTPLYLPPEMLFNQGEEEEVEYDQKIDVWSLGVSLFQAYFHIHPFFYDKIDTVNDKGFDHKQVYKQLKQNIRTLLPEFKMQKFLNHLWKCNKGDICESIRNKLQVTHPELINQFSSFFQYQKQRPQIEYFVGVYDSLQQQIKNTKCTASRIIKPILQIPSDMRFYIRTLNLFYELCSKYGTQKKEEVEFHLQLGMWYWNYYNYLGTMYVNYYQEARLKAYKKLKEILWEEVQKTLLDYFLEISTNEELTFYQNLPILRVSILLCGARYKITKQTQKFISNISSKTGLQMNTLQDLQNFLEMNILEIAQLKKIEDTLMNQYYYD